MFRAHVLVALFLSIVVLSGCGASSDTVVTLTKGGDRIQIVEPSAVQNCQSVGMLKIRHDEAATFEANAEGAERDALNQTHQRGATHLVHLETMAPEGCTQCAVFKGKMYSCSR